LISTQAATWRGSFCVADLCPGRRATRAPSGPTCADSVEQRERERRVELNLGGRKGTERKVLGLGLGARISRRGVRAHEVVSDSSPPCRRRRRRGPSVPVRRIATLTSSATTTITGYSPPGRTVLLSWCEPRGRRAIARLLMVIESAWPSRARSNAKPSQESISDASITMKLGTVVLFTIDRLARLRGRRRRRSSGKALPCCRPRGG
jgi:hypothetical protein